MQLLLEHSQHGKVFRLWAKYELSGQEQSLAEQYGIRQVVLVEGNPREEWSRARKMAGALAILVYVGSLTRKRFYSRRRESGDAFCCSGCVDDNRVAEGFRAGDVSGAS